MNSNLPEYFNKLRICKLNIAVNIWYGKEWLGCSFYFAKKVIFPPVNKC